MTTTPRIMNPRLNFPPVKPVTPPASQPSPHAMKTSAKNPIVRLLTFALLALLGVYSGAAASFTSAANGDWNLGATWGNAGNDVEGSGYPGTGDTVTIRAGDAVTVTANAAAASITFSNISTSAATLTVNSSVTLNVSGGITLQNAATANTAATITGAGTINCASVTVGGTTVPTSGTPTTTLTSSIGALAISGNLTITGQDPGTPDNDAIFNLASGSVSVGGTVAFTTVGTGTAALSMANGAQTGTLTLSGATPFSGTGTFSPNGTSATVEYSRSGTQTVNPVAYRNLTLSGSGIKTLQTATTAINGNLALSGTASATTVAALTIGGNLSIGDGASFTVAGFNITVSGTTTVGAGTSGTLNISSATGTSKFFVGLVTINAGGTWNNSGNSTVSFRGGITLDPAGTFTAGTGVNTFDTGSQTLTGTFSIPSVTVSSVTLNNSGTLTVNTALSGTGGTLAQGSGATLNIGGTSAIATLNAAASGNTVNYSGGAQTVKAATYHHLTLSGSLAKTMSSGTTVNGNFTLSGTATATLGAALSVGGNVTIGSGTTLDASTSNHGLSVGGTWSNSGTFTARAGTVTFNGTASQALASATTFSGLTINNSAGVTLGASPTVTNLTLTAGQLDNSVNNITLANGATISRATGTLAVAPAFGTTVNVAYTGATGVTTGQEIPASTTVLSGLTINNSGGVALGASLTTTNLTLTSGALSIGANTLTVNGTISTTSGSLTGGSSANIIFNGSGATTLPAVSLNNLTVNRSAVAISLGGPVTVDGTLNLTLGALSIGANTLTINGAISTASGTLTGGTTSDIVVGGSGASTTLPAVSLRNLTLDRANGLALGGTVTIAATGTLTLANGQLDNSVNNVSLTSGATISRAVGTLAAAPTFNTTVNLIYTGGTGVTTGPEIPTVTTILNNLTINNTGGVLLGANVTSKGVVTIGSGASLNAADKTITLSWTTLGTPLVVDGTFNPGTSTVLYTGTAGANVTGGINYYNLTVNSSGDTFTAAGDLTVQNLLTVQAGTFNAASRIITLSGSGTPLVVSGTFTPSTSTIAYTSGSGATVAVPASGYNNLTINGAGTFALGGSTTVGGTLALSSGGLSLGSNLLTLNGPFSATSGTLTGGASANITIGGSGAGTLPAVALNNLIVNRSTGIILGGAVSVGGTLTLTSGQISSAGNLTLGNGASISRATGSLDAGVPTFSGTVNVTYTSGGVITGTELPTSTSALQALSFNNASGTVTLAANATANGTLTIASGGTLADGGNTLTVKSTVSNSGTHSSSGSGKILFNAGSAQTFAGTYGNVELDNASGTSSGTLTINGNLKVTSGTFTIPGVTMLVSGLTTIDSTLAITGTTGTKTFGGVTIGSSGTWNNSANEDISIKGNFENNGTFTAGTSAALYTFDGIGSQNISGSVIPTFASLTIANTTMPVTASGNFNVSSAFAISANVVFTPDPAVVINNAAAQGTLSGSGTIKVTRTAATADLVNQYKFTTRTLTSLTVDYAGAGAQTINNTGTHANLTTSGSGTKTLAGDLTVSGVLTVGSGTALDGGSAIITLSGAPTPFVVNGTFTPSGSTIKHTSAAAANNVTGGLTYNNLWISAGAVGDIYTVTNGNIAVNGDLTITAGTLDLGSFTADRTTSGGVLTLANAAAAKLKIGGTGTLPANYATHAIGAAGIIEYSGTTQTIAPLNGSAIYGSLTTSGSGTKFITAGLEVAGTFTIAGATAPVVVQSGGAITNATTIFTLSGTTPLTFASGARYVHNRNGGTIVTAVWNANSTCEITGATSTQPGGLGQAFGNFTWNPAAQAANNLNLAGALTNVNGDFTVVNTGTTGSLRLSASTAYTLSVGGNLSVQGGRLALVGSSSGFTPSAIVNVSNNVSVTGGTLDVRGASANTSGSVTLNVFGDFNVAASGTVTPTVGAISNNINFAKSGTQTYSNAGTVSGQLAWAVNAGSTLQGSGALNGALVVNGTLAPGSAIGTLTLNTPPALNGTLLMELNPTNAPTADLLALTTGTLTNAGTLVVTNIGPAPAMNSVFTLLNAPAYSGAFVSFTLPPGGTNHWKTNNLTVNGTLTFTNNNPEARAITTTVALGGVATIPFDLGKYKLATDADNDSLTIATATGAAHGTLGVAPNGLSMSYTNTGGAPGTVDTFTYVVSDGVGGLATNTVAVTLNAAQGYNLLSANGSTLTYFGIIGAQYALENTAILTPATWVPVVTNTAGADGKIIFNLASPGGFYRTRYVSGP